MTFNRSESQQFFESMFPGNNGKPFHGLPKNTYENTIINNVQAAELALRLNREVSSHYYKALLSYAEGIRAITTNNFSWATVKLYYSVFYASKAFLACKGIALVRAERRLFYVRTRNGERIKKCRDTTDHKATMLTLEDLFSSQDMLQSNTISEKSAYEWMMEKREEVNYKDIDFHDPEAPEFWEKISELVASQGIFKLIEDLINDSWLYCFQEEYGVLAIPTKRLMLTVEAMRLAGQHINVDDEKKRHIEEYFIDGSDIIRQKLLSWA